MIAGLRPAAVVGGDEVPGLAVRGAAGEVGGLAQTGARLGEAAAGDVGRDALVLELADGKDGADGFEDIHGRASFCCNDTSGAGRGQNSEVSGRGPNGSVVMDSWTD